MLHSTLFIDNVVDIGPVMTEVFIAHLVVKYPGLSTKSFHAYLQFLLDKDYNNL
jgi:hypothetical protein